MTKRRILYAKPATRVLPASHRHNRVDDSGRRMSTKGGIDPIVTLFRRTPDVQVEVYLTRQSIDGGYTRGLRHRGHGRDWDGGRRDVPAERGWWAYTGGMSDEEVPLTGGNITPVVRVGATVRRATGPWTPAVHALLRHLEAVASRVLPGSWGSMRRAAKC